MEKKIYKFISVAVIAVAMVVSVQINNADNDISLMDEYISSAFAEIKPIREFAVSSFDPITGEWKQCCYRDPYATACIPYNC